MTTRQRKPRGAAKTWHGNPGLKAHLVPVKDLSPDPSNARLHSERNLEAIQASYQEFGQQKPVVAAPNGRVIAGNGQLQAAKSLGWTHIAAITFPSEDAARQAAYAIADNRTSEHATWDPDALTATLDALTEELHDATGFTTKELDALLTSLQAPKPGSLQGDDDDKTPPPVPTTKPGEVIHLGDHVLVCGDATQPRPYEALEREGLLPAHLLWTDPPYGIDYASKNKALNASQTGNRIQTPIEGDKQTPDAMHQLWVKSLRHVHDHCHPGAAYYITGPQGGDLHQLLGAAAAAAGWQLKHTLIWVKNNHVLGRSDYHYQHEPILYGWKKGRHQWYGGRKQTSLINIDRPHKSSDHPTTKPLELVAQHIQNNTRKTQTILDPFLGSGTTLLAAEQLSRRCAAIELTPGYCDVAIRRWQDLTGEKAIRRPPK